MRPADYTEEQIIEAGQQLQADGRRVTGFALRKVIGGGNPKRLSTVWEAHRQQQEVVESEPVQELPMEVEDALGEMTSAFLDQVRQLALTLNNKAVNTAERRVADVMRSAQQQQERAEAELVDAGETVDDLEERLEALKDQLETVSAQYEETFVTLNDTQQTLRQSQQDLAVQAEKLEAERTRRQVSDEKLGELKEQNQELKQDKAALRKERDDALKQVEKKDQALVVLQAERDNLSDTRGELKAQLASLSERESAALKKAAEQDKVLTALRKEREKALQEAARFQAEADQATTHLQQVMSTFSSEQKPAKSKR